MEALATSIGEHLSHQTKFEGVRKEIEEELRSAEDYLQVSLLPCSLLQHVEDRKSDHLVCSVMT